MRKNNPWGFQRVGGSRGFRPETGQMIEQWDQISNGGAVNPGLPPATAVPPGGMRSQNAMMRVPPGMSPGMSSGGAVNPGLPTATAQQMPLAQQRMRGIMDRFRGQIPQHQGDPMRMQGGPNQNGYVPPQLGDMNDLIGALIGSLRGQG